MRQRNLVLVSGLVFAASLWGLVGAAESRNASASVNVRLFEFKLIPNVKSVAAGKVTFVVRNTGKLRHEFVVIRTRKPASKLLKGAEANETGAVGELGDVKPGRTLKLVLNLKAGHYALICNLPGHYKAGQYADLTVR